MGLTDAEKERVRYHLGYLTDLQAVASFALGMPRIQQPFFLVETAIAQLKPQGEERVRGLIQKMDDLDCKITDAADTLIAESVDSVKLRAGLPDLLEREYVRQGLRLADALGVPVNPYSDKYRRVLSSGGGNIPVQG